MQFLAIGRLIEQPVVPAEMEMALLKATFIGFDQRADKRILGAYPFADQRATALLVEVDTADELAELLGGLPASRLSTWEAHPLGTPAGVLRLLSQWEVNLSQ